jgi:monoamine oxidase
MLSKDVSSGGPRGGRRARRPRSPGIRSVRALLAADAESARSGVPVQELLGAGEQARPERAHAERTYTRREALAGGAALTAGAALAARPGVSQAQPPSRSAPRIAIVGAGLAGLRCAHLLWTQHGRAGFPSLPVAATVYDANPERAGGRCWTLRGFFADGALTEHGGAFVDTTHVAIRRLAAQLGLAEEVVNGGDLSSGEDIYFIDGAYYTRAQATADWIEVGFDAFREAARELGSPAGERRLDSMSVPEWLQSTEIGAGSRLGKLMLANTVTENGGDPGDQSALDLIEITAPSKRSTLELLPGDDERYHIVGGNDQIVSRMVSALAPAAVQHGHELVALREGADRTITLSFAVGARMVDVTADYVVLALPFSKLREVELSKSGLSAAKQTVIRTLGMGSNAKIHVELGHKTWPQRGFSGATYSEWDSYCCAWDDSVPLGPDGSPALLLGFPGGRVGRSGLTGEAHGSAPDADVAWFLSQIEPVYPGTTAAYTGRAYEDHWARDPWVLGAYSYFRVGQASSYGALAAAAEGRFHFAGEHTSPEFQGFLDGAVSTGERAARELLSRI